MKNIIASSIKYGCLTLVLIAGTFATVPFPEAQAGGKWINPNQRACGAPGENLGGCLGLGIAGGGGNNCVLWLNPVTNRYEIRC